LRFWLCYVSFGEKMMREISIATDEQRAMSVLDRSGFAALFIRAMLTISVIGSIYICFLAR
jgi:fructose-specific phosphotransferase system IIC component